MHNEVASATHFVPIAYTLPSVDALETVHAEPRYLADHPNYRVNFWERPRPGQAWNLEAFALTKVSSVAEVLKWVDEHVDGRRFEVFAETDDESHRSFDSPRRSGLLRLLGSNPNDSEKLDKT